MADPSLSAYCFVPGMYMRHTLYFVLATEPLLGTGSAVELKVHYTGTESYDVS